MGAEWTYLLTTRKVAGDDSAFSYVRLTYGSNPTDTITGVIIYPDDFSFADAGVGAMRFGGYAPVQIDIDAWEALEEAGCVFLPSQRFMRPTSDGTWEIQEEFCGIRGSYMSATTGSAGQSLNAFFNIQEHKVSTTDTDAKCVRRIVRLVQDY